jgi:DNA-binding MarR family transcriptional regulator
VSSATSTPDDPVPWLSPEELQAWMALTAMLMTLPAAIDAQLKRDSGLNFFEYSILVALARPSDKKLQMSTLAQLAGGSLSRLSHAVTRLERQGWVRRRAQTGESRCIEAILTDEGMAALVAAAPGHVREARRLVFESMTPAQVRQLQRVCRQIVDVAAPGTGPLLDRAVEESAG